jgi:50S ribosomal subunit-associated GTPase HflX
MNGSLKNSRSGKQAIEKPERSIVTEIKSLGRDTKKIEENEKKANKRRETLQST